VVAKKGGRLEGETRRGGGLMLKEGGGWRRAGIIYGTGKGEA